MSREALLEMARREVENYHADRIDLAPSTVKVPATDYFDREMWELELDRVFKRLPLALAFTCEMRDPGTYRSLEVLGTPVLIVRGDDGVARAFLNTCSHRGAVITEEPAGQAKGFRCPYHAWSYDLEGRLVSIFDNGNFGDVDKGCYGLTALPTAERAGIIWVTLKPGSNVDIDDFLAGYDDVLGDLGFADCYVAGRQPLEGPNWKVAFDGYRDLYHIPILHKNSFGPNAAYRPDYYHFGAHCRMVSPQGAKTLADKPEDQWTHDELITGVWTIFPNISIAAFDAGGKVYMVSQMFPGKNPGESHTTQHFLHTRPPDAEQAAKMAGTMAFLREVVGNEDYATGLKLQKGLMSGARDHVLFGRNEGGGQQFHKWVEALVATEDHDLPQLLTSGV